MLEESAQYLKSSLTPQITSFLRAWRRQVLVTELVIAAALVILLAAGSLYFQGLSGLAGLASLPSEIASSGWLQAFSVIVILVLIWGHFTLRRSIGRRLIAKTINPLKDTKLKTRMQRILNRNVRWWRSIFCSQPAGLNSSKQHNLEIITADAREYIQKLNDAFTSPSGSGGAKEQQNSSAWSAGQQSDKG
jgi:hypothetical protein